MSNYRPTRRMPGETSPGPAPQTQNRQATAYPPLYEDEDERDTRMPTSTRRYPNRAPALRPRQEMNVVIHRRASRPRETEPVPVPRRQREEDDEQDLLVPVPRRHRSFWHRVHPMVSIGGAMCATLALVIGGQTLFSALAITHDDWTYERPRLSQVDARVGHNDRQTPTHFMVLNLHGQLFIFECPGGDCTKARVYLGPVLTGAGADLAPATITVKDVNGDGAPDLVVRVQDSIFVLINDHGTFRPRRPDEVVNLLS